MIQPVHCRCSTVQLSENQIGSLMKKTQTGTTVSYPLRNTSPSGTPLALVAVGCYDGGVASSATFPALDPAFAAAFRDGTLTERQAEQFVRQGAAAVAFQLLELSARIESGRLPLVGPLTPSGAIPPYAKPAVEPEKPKF